MSYDLTTERRAVLRRYAEVIQSAAYETTMLAHYGEMLALLDAADEADRLTAEMFAAEGALLGDSPELPRWERALLNGLTLPELAREVADERDRLAAAIERVRALADGWRYKGEFGWGAWQEGYGPDEHDELLDYAACEIIRAIDGTDDGPTT